ncbi:MAG: hypothetical protein QOF98_3065, partial [Streptomyces sp.]|nr:hypothetical protein [Streptomyces sp.]
LGGLMWLSYAGRLLTWRITATSTGLNVRAYFRSRRIPWRQIRTVTHEDSTLTVIFQPDPADPRASRIRLTNTAFPFLTRFRPLPTPRIAAQLTALLRHPALRPAKD